MEFSFFDEIMDFDEILDDSNNDSISSSNNASTSKRFVSISDSDRMKILHDAVPVNSRYKSQWAMRIFNKWNRKRLNDNFFATDLQVLGDLEVMTKSDLDWCLQKFTFEVRKQNGGKYPPETLRQIIVGLFSYMKYTFNKSWNFYRDEMFSESRKCLDAVMKSLTKDGLGCRSQKVLAITLNIED